MLTQADIERGLQSLGLGKQSHVLVHSSYKSFGGVEGGPATVARVLVEKLGTVMMPAFTSDRTGVWAASGIFEGNAYALQPWERGAPLEPYSHDTPMNATMGVINETLRTSYPVHRSLHPSGSFIAFGALAEQLTGTGTEEDGVEPIRRLADAGGDVLLLGVTHTNSTAIHLAEQLAGRPLFLRHALTSDGVRAARGGGCGSGFDALQPHVAHLERRATIGGATLRCFELQPYVEAARALIVREPHALLCDKQQCDRCNAHRSRVLV